VVTVSTPVNALLTRRRSPAYLLPFSATRIFGDEGNLPKNSITTPSKKNPGAIGSPHCGGAMITTRSPRGATRETTTSAPSNTLLNADVCISFIQAHLHGATARRPITKRSESNVADICTQTTLRLPISDTCALQGIETEAQRKPAAAIGAAISLSVRREADVNPQVRPTSSKNR